LEVYTRSYRRPKWQESQFGEFWDSQLGVLGKTPFGCNPCGESKEFYEGEGGGFPPSSGCGESYEPV